MKLHFRTLVLSFCFLFVNDLYAFDCAGHKPFVTGADQNLSHWKCREEYSDEFENSSLDPNRWSASVPSWGSSWVWDRSNVALGDGMLTVKMQYQPQTANGKVIYYSSGIVKSVTKPLKYGFIEARIKAADRFPGVCSAFWLYRADPDEWTEIDIVELLQRANSRLTMDHSLVAFRLADGFRGHLVDMGSSFANADPSSIFHVYGLSWDDDYIKWYVDGMLVRERKNVSWHQALDITFSIGLRQPLTKNPSADGFPAAMSVDYIRVWKQEK